MGKTLRLKISEDSQKTAFGKVLFKQIEMSNLSPVLNRKLTPSQMFLVSVPRIFKIAMRASCGETTSKVAYEIFALDNFVENSINWCVLKSSCSRYF